MADHPRLNWAAITARLNAHAQLRDWGIDDSAYHTLEPLLGIPNVDQMTEGHIRICELLCGPHGWAVYQMLKARMKHDQPCDD